MHGVQMQAYKRRRYTRVLVTSSVILHCPQDYTPVCTTELGEVTVLAAGHACCPRPERFTGYYHGVALHTPILQPVPASLPFRRAAELVLFCSQVGRLQGAPRRLLAVVHACQDSPEQILAVCGTPVVSRCGAAPHSAFTFLRAGEFAKRGVKVLALSSNDSESHKG